MKIFKLLIFVLTIFLLVSCGPVDEPNQTLKQGEAVSSVLRIIDGNYTSYSTEIIKLASPGSTGTYLVTIVYSNYELKVMYHYEVIKISVIFTQNKETL
jgi:hypothetical protein